jgi:hypothetical protein
VSKLSRLEKVERVRDVWPDEARDFTPWLTDPLNISILAEALGLGADGLEYEADEQPVGPFRADIVCRDTTSPENRRVLIENQFGRSDHDHLGKLLTYASGLDAYMVVLIGEQIREEHRQALSWLNSISNEEHRFFACEIELWRIGDSLPAPRFNVVVEPNEWAKMVSASSDRGGAGSSEFKQKYVQYWEAFSDALLARTREFHVGRPKAQQWMTFRSGKAGVYFAVGATQRDQYIRVSVVIQNENAKSLFEQLFKFKSEIEADLGFTLEWDAKPHAQRVVVHRMLSNTFPMDQTDWRRQHDWLITNLISFNRVFRPRIQALSAHETDE